MVTQTSQFEALRNSLASLCSEALQGNLSLDDFYARWPAELGNSEFATLLHDDIEDGVQHLPAKFFTGEPDLAAWKKSHMFFTIYADKQLLLSVIPEHGLVEIRNKILQERHLTVEKIDSYFANHSGKSP